MRHTTGQKLKLIIITWFYLCLTIINCDENSVKKNNVFESMLLEQPSNAPGKLEIKTPAISDIVRNSELSLKQSKTQENLNNVKPNSESNPSVDVKNDTKNITSKNVNVTSHVNSVAISNSTLATTRPPRPVPNVFSQPINTGALLRGFYVFMGLSIILIAYVMFRCMRLNKTQTQMVRKYGVLAHRQDVEMRPLPLDDEDEDDTTVFDASEVAIHDKQHEST